MSLDIKKIQKEIVALASSRSNKLHVIPTSGKWAVVKDGSKRTFRKFSSESDAINFSKVYAKSHFSEIVIHNRNAEVKKKISKYTSIPKAIN